MARPAPGDRPLLVRRYSPREIAEAVGVSEHRVRAEMGISRGAGCYVSHDEAVRIGRTLHQVRFSVLSSGGRHSSTRMLPLALSSTVPASVFVAAVAITTLGLSPAQVTRAAEPFEPTRLVFLAQVGPGGGGGGGGAKQKTRPPKATEEGERWLRSPLPARDPPKPIEAAPAPPDPEPAPEEPLPVVDAPLAHVAADERTTPGVLEESPIEDATRGAGSGDGVGAGEGSGIGDGEGSGVGEGTGGGTGGGPYRPGSGIEPPRLLREVKPDYSDEARLQRLEGEVVMEIVVLHDGTVGDLTILHGLGGGLNERALRAVRQWRFAPARRRGVPVDVVVEVAVEFKLR